MTSIRFIHTADLHLDSPFKGMTGLSAQRLNMLRESTFQAFEKLIDHAVNTVPHFMLIVGDIYDGEDRSLRAQMKFHEGMEKLHQAGIPVYLSYGNHDHLAGKWTRFNLPPNVHEFDGNIGEAHLHIDGQAVVIHGFSYKERHIRQAMIEQFPQGSNDDVVHIGMLHGSLAGDVSHDVYAPFTKEQLLQKQYHYWALGHIHLRQVLQTEPAIVYPGNIQGRHRNERGLKGFYEVTLSNREAELEFISTSATVFERAEVSCANIGHANEWLQACKDVIATYQMKYGPCILELTMTDVDESSLELFNQSTPEQWLAVLQENISDDMWVQKLTISEPKSIELHATALTQAVLTTMNNWTKEDWKDVLKDVYQHTSAIKYLDVLTEDDVIEVKTAATALLSREMAETK